MDIVDFGTETEEQETKSSVGADIAKSVADDQQEETLVDDPATATKKADDSEEASTGEPGQDAFIMFEDENYIFTSEGIVEKASLKQQDNSRDAEPGEKDEKILGKFENYDELVKSYQELEGKLGENSNAVNKLRELNPVLPILEAMLGDDTFLAMTEQYFSDPQAQSEAIKKQLGVDDNFVFDLNNALTDPKSEDAKVLNKLMQVKQPKQTQTKPKQSDQISDQQKQDIIKKYNLSESEYDHMMEKAANHKITHDDIYFLMNKEKILADARKEAQSNVKKQMETAQRLRKPVSTGGAATNGSSPEDIFINSLQAGKGLFDE
jgi:hypothetical protein